MDGVLTAPNGYVLDTLGEPPDYCSLFSIKAWSETCLADDFGVVEAFLVVLGERMNELPRGLFNNCVESTENAYRRVHAEDHRIAHC